MNWIHTCLLHVIIIISKKDIERGIGIGKHNKDEEKGGRSNQQNKWATKPGIIC